MLDATLDAPDLTIDAQDNMLTRQARITLVQECADIDLRGTPEQPVRVEQGSGFSAPLAEVDSPSLVARITKTLISHRRWPRSDFRRVDMTILADSIACSCSESQVRRCLSAHA